MSGKKSLVNSTNIWNPVCKVRSEWDYKWKMPIANILGRKIVTFLTMFTIMMIFMGCSPTSTASTAPSIMQEYYNSPNQLAQQEWLAFLDNYDKDRSLLKANNNNESNIPKDYFAYNCYTWDMVNEVDAIRDKYGLDLLTKQELIQHGEETLFLDRIGIESIFRDDAKAETTYRGGYYYSEGTFDIACVVTLTGEDAEWGYQVAPSYRYSLKKYFDPVCVHIESSSNSEQWVYTTAGGDEVLITLDDNNGSILCDQGEAFVVVEMYFGGKSNFKERIDKKALEQIADIFDFSISPQPVSNAVNETDPNSLASNSSQPVEANSTYSFADCIRKYLDTSYYPEEPVYALMDLNNDGIAELIVKNFQADGIPYLDIFTEKENNVFQLDDIAVNYICENKILEVYIKTDNIERHEYYQLVSDGFTLIDSVSFKKASQKWIRVLDGSWKAPSVEISESEAHEIISSYDRVNLEMKPCSEFIH